MSNFLKSRQEDGNTSSPHLCKLVPGSAAQSAHFTFSAATNPLASAVSINPGCQWLQLGAASSPELISPLALSLTNWDEQVCGHSIPEPSPRLLLCMLEERGRERYRRVGGSKGVLARSKLQCDAKMLFEWHRAGSNPWGAVLMKRGQDKLSPVPLLWLSHITGCWGP